MARRREALLTFTPHILAFPLEQPPHPDPLSMRRGGKRLGSFTALEVAEIYAEISEI